MRRGQIKPHGALELCQWHPDQITVGLLSIRLVTIDLDPRILKFDSESA